MGKVPTAMRVLQSLLLLPGGDEASTMALVMDQTPSGSSIISATTWTLTAGSSLRVGVRRTSATTICTTMVLVMEVVVGIMVLLVIQADIDVVRMNMMKMKVPTTMKNMMTMIVSVAMMTVSCASMGTAWMKYPQRLGRGNFLSSGSVEFFHRWALLYLLCRLYLDYLLGPPLPPPLPMQPPLPMLI